MANLQNHRDGNAYSNLKRRTGLDSTGMAENLNAVLSASMDEIRANCEDLIRDYAKKMVKELRKGEGLPRRDSKSIKDYLSGWTSTTQEAKYAQHAGIEAIVYNKTPGLAHLLENGHAMRQGGRAQAFPHIKPVEERIIEEFQRELEKRISGGKK